MKKHQIIADIIGKTRTICRERASAFAPINIALCKYWGKRNTEINLPTTSSLSISLPSLGTTTTITFSDDKDEVFLEENRVEQNSLFYRRVVEFLQLFRPNPYVFFSVSTKNTVPTAAGLASSSSGFAALILALNNLFEWKLDRKKLSILARIGSGSACRSLYPGFVQWHAGKKEDGMDSYAEPLPAIWEDFCLGIITVSREKKSISSREAMAKTVQTSEFYSAWSQKVATDFCQIKNAIFEQNIQTLGTYAESNALSMHGSMLGARPPILYFLPESIEIIRKVWLLREQGMNIYVTMDAGPNVKLLFLEENIDEIHSSFPRTQIIRPFNVRAYL